MTWLSTNDIDVTATSRKICLLAIHAVQGFLFLIVDISELNLPKTCSISFPNGKDDLMNFEVTIHPDEGYYL